MAFMEKQITGKTQWLEIDGSEGITFVTAGSLEDSGLKVGESTDDDEVMDRYSDYYGGSEIHSVSLIEGFGARLSAQGYMDCTDWTVFSTSEEAQSYLEETYPEDEDEEE
jgi:hypothetical protein